MKKIPQKIWILIITLILLKLWLVAAQPLFAITYTTHDDRLFLRLAQYLLNGEWLGLYNNLTLAKGPFYPAFIAMTFLLSLPLLLSEHLVYIAACIAFIIALLPLLKKPVYPLILIAVLLFNAVSFELSAQRVIRDYLYTSLTLLSLACAIGLLLKIEEKWQRMWWWAIGLGMSLTAFWLTREEGIWLLPALGLIIAFATLKIWLTRPVDWKSKIALWTGGLVIPVILTLIVSGLNWFNYGVFAKTEFDSKIFKSAYGSLTRVNAGKTIPYVPVSRKMRMNIYDISSTFAELRPYLEGKAGEGWAINGRKTRENRGEIQGAWFMWAFRDAIAQAGYYSSGKFPAEFYQRMTKEITTACDNHWLDCYPERSSMMPPWHFDYFKPLVKNFYTSLLFITEYQGLTRECLQSSGTETDSWIFLDLTREKICGANGQTEIDGWVYYEDGPVELSVIGEKGEKIKTITERNIHADINAKNIPNQGKVIPGSDNIGFSILSQCPFGCELEISNGNILLARFPFFSLSSQKLIEQDKLHLFIGKITTRPLMPEQMKLDTLKIHFLNGIMSLYQSINLPLMMMALAFYLYLSVILLTKKRERDLWVVATILLVGMICRVMLIALIHTTSFEAISASYLSPAYPLMLTFMCLVIFGASDDILGQLKSKSQVLEAKEIEGGSHQ